MKQKLFWLLFLSFPFLNVFSQYKEKFFKEGYVIRQNDTIKCKIYLKSIEELQEKIVYKYKDGDEPITYYPGSIIKGFGLTIDGKNIQYTTVPYPLNKKGTKIDLIFAEVVTNGFLKIFKYSFYRENLNMAGTSTNSARVFVPTKTKSKKAVVDYFIYRSDIDSSSHLSSYMSDNMVKLNKELVDHFFGDNPDLLKKIELDITLVTFVQYVEEYNAWFKKKNKKE